LFLIFTFLQAGHIAGSEGDADAMNSGFLDDGFLSHLGELRLFTVPSIQTTVPGEGRKQDVALKRELKSAQIHENVGGEEERMKRVTDPPEKSFHFIFHSSRERQETVLDLS
jgi:hypothetical protein